MEPTGFWQPVFCSSVTLETVCMRTLGSQPRHDAASTDSSILIVDDDEAVTQTFARMLQLEGFRVRTAQTVEIGLREAAEHRPAAIILDMRMPLIDGLGFLRRLRALDEQRHTPVAIVTGDYFLNEAVVAELQQLGAALTFKPLWLEGLLALARQLLKVTH